MAKAKGISGIGNETILIEKALQLFVAVENKKQISSIIGKIEFDEEAFK